MSLTNFVIKMSQAAIITLWMDRSPLGSGCHLTPDTDPGRQDPGEDASKEYKDEVKSRTAHDSIVPGGQLGNAHLPDTVIGQVSLTGNMKYR